MTDHLPTRSSLAMQDSKHKSIARSHAGMRGVAKAPFGWLPPIPALLAVVAVLTCGEDSVAPPEPTSPSESATVTASQEPTTVTISPAEAELTALGSTVRLRAEVRDQNGQVMSVSGVVWASGDASVMAVDETGLATAVGNGVAELSASAGGISASAEVTVAQRVSAVSVSPGAETLAAVGETVRLRAEAVDANGHPVAGAEFEWASGDASVATVDETGLATAVGNGVAELSASAGGISAGALVTVAQEVGSVSVGPSAHTLASLEETVRLRAEAVDANGHPVADAEFEWASGDLSVATVDGSGLATAVGNGVAELSASAGGLSANATVTVAQQAASVSVSPETATLASLDETVRLKAEALDANGHMVAGTEFEWKSADASVATVDDAGLATAVANGAVALTAASGALSANVAVTVAQQVASVSVSPGSATLVSLDETVRLEAEALDANGHAVAGAEFEWKSADASVATVDGEGLATAVANGAAALTATSGEMSADAEVTVAQAVRSISVSGGADTLTALGQTARLSAEALDANGHAVAGVAFEWASGDASVVSIDGAGVATAVGNGTAALTVTAGGVSVPRYAGRVSPRGAANGAPPVAAYAVGASGSTAVTVSQQVAKVFVLPREVAAKVGESASLVAVAVDRNGYELVGVGNQFEWESSDYSIAQVHDGLAWAIASGSATLTATSSGVSGSATITVKTSVW